MVMLGKREKNETPKVEAKQKETQDVKSNILTPNEMAIFQRVKGETQDWKTITEESVDDYSLMQDPFRLPAEVKAYELKKEFKFRWVERTSARLDEVRSAPVPTRWWIVNAETFKDLEGLCDPILGCISRQDQMLVFKPWWMHEKRMQIQNQLNEAQDRSGLLESRDGENRDGVQFIAGKKSGENPTPLRGEIKAGDKIEYEETGTEAHGLSDLITE